MRSVVRLRDLNSCPNWVAYNPKPMLGYFRIESGSAIGNGKLKTSLMGRDVRGGLMGGDGINKVIESIPQIAEGIGHHQRPALDGSGLVKIKNQAESGAIRVSFCDETIRVSVIPGFDFSVDGLSVFLTPRQLGAHACQI